MRESDKPADVDVGDLVVFRLVPMEHQKPNSAPVAIGVEKLLYLGGLSATDGGTADVSDNGVPGSGREVSPLPPPPPPAVQAERSNARDLAALRRSMEKANLAVVEAAQQKAAAMAADGRIKPMCKKGQVDGEEVQESTEVFMGKVEKQSRKDPSKFFITCEQLAGRYASDIKLLEENRPGDVQVGDDVQFSLMEVSHGAPLAVNVVRVDSGDNAAVQEPVPDVPPPPPPVKRPRTSWW